MDLHEMGLTVLHPWADRGRTNACKICYGQILHEQMQQGLIEHPRGCQKPQMGNTCDTYLTTIESQGKWNPSTKRIPEDMCINEDLLYKEISCPSRLGLFKRISMREKTSIRRKRCQPSTTIKAQIPSQIKVRIIYPSLALQSCENSSNLIFRGYSAGTTPVLSFRSSLFAVQISL